MNNCIICLDNKVINSICYTCIDSKICYKCINRYKKNICPICKKLLLDINFFFYFIIIFKYLKFFILYYNLIYNLYKLENLIKLKIDLIFDLINIQILKFG